MIEINWDELHQAEEKKLGEEEKARQEYYARLSEKEAKKDEELTEMLSELGKRAMDEEKSKMEMEQAEEERKALEAVRARYRNRHGSQEWNSSAEDKAWEKMSRSIFGE